MVDREGPRSLVAVEGLNVGVALHPLLAFAQLLRAAVYALGTPLPRLFPLTDVLCLTSSLKPAAPPRRGSPDRPYAECTPQLGLPPPPTFPSLPRGLPCLCLLSAPPPAAPPPPPSLLGHG